MRITLNAEEAKMLKQIGSNYPEVLNLLVKLRSDELEEMSQSSDEFFRVYKGRTQILTELRQAFRP